MAKRMCLNSTKCHWKHSQRILIALRSREIHGGLFWKIDIHVSFFFVNEVKSIPVFMLEMTQFSA